jgi:DNA-nicking Smr family endonuclease
VPAATDRELFLDALKGMDTVFEDAFPPEEEVQQVLPRRMKLLRQGRLVPEAKIDLHGLTREEARTKVGYFLEDSVYQGKKTVLIVTGRGKGSGGEPVLRAEVERYLSTEGGVCVGTAAKGRWWCS